jgi:hypothetical protein
VQCHAVSTVYMLCSAALQGSLTVVLDAAASAVVHVRRLSGVQSWNMYASAVKSSGRCTCLLCAYACQQQVSRCTVEFWVAAKLPHE